jgi:hypothetical protein
MSDDRDWSRYNDSLVRRGEIGLDPSVLRDWSNELKGANDGKIGEPYHYPESFFRLIASVRLLFHTGRLRGSSSSSQSISMV